MSTPNPRVFISYSHDSDSHRSNIIDLANVLRRNYGIDAWLDAFVESTPPASWPNWMYDEVEKADFVLLVCTETYARRFRGHEDSPGIGLGVRWEGAIITSSLYFAQSDHVKFIPVVVNGEDRRHIMAPLSVTSMYVVGDENGRNLDPLVAHLLGRPLVEPSPLGNPHNPQEPEVTTPSLDVLRYLAEGGDLSEALNRLESLIGSSGPDVSEEAAFCLGRLLETDGQMAAAINAYYRCAEFNGRYLEEAKACIARANAELQRHYGPGSAVEAASTWLTAISEGNMQLVWQLTQRNLRLALVQAWILANERRREVARYDREELARELSKIEPNHPLREGFFGTQLRELQYAYQGFNPTTWGAAERPRRFGVEFEMVILMDTEGEELRWQPGEWRAGFTLILKREITEWKLAGFEQLLVPGWPPTYSALPGQDPQRPAHDQ